MISRSRLAAAFVGAAAILPVPLAGQATMTRHAAPAATSHESHRTASLDLGGWRLGGMLQGYALGSTGEDWGEPTPLGERALYFTQPALMATLAAPDGNVSLRTTLNFEGWTQPDGELTYGAWGEGFLDRRHPHTLLHEAMLTVRFPEVPGGTFSLSAGKGFAPYGTEDPMGRPVAKFPTNHHLSQVVERFTAIAAYRGRGGTSLELGIFGGSEPTGVYDFSNIKDFGNSFSARVTQRFGGAARPWEASASYARITERHHDNATVTHLKNIAVRHDAAYRFGTVTALAEASHATAPEGERYWSVLAEGRLGLGTDGRHQPYFRSELSTRPEYQREGEPGSPGFFRYDHDHALLRGASRWFTQTVGYGVAIGGYPASAMPFIEVQRFEVRRERGNVSPDQLFGRDGFWSATAGVRLFLGGGTMRMGSYGIADASAHQAPAPHSDRPMAMQGGGHAHH